MTLSSCVSTACAAAYFKSFEFRRARNRFQSLQPIINLWQYFSNILSDRERYLDIIQVPNWSRPCHQFDAV